MESGMEFGMLEDVVWHGMCRRVFDTHVQWIPQVHIADPDVEYVHYAVHRYAFVPEYCLVHYFVEDSDDDDAEIVLSTHKTLTEAMGICKVLLANGGVVFYG
jgi:hypothetical protein